MAKMFVTDRNKKGQEIVAGKYLFVDGLLAVSDADAELIAPILCRFYGCTLETVDERAAEVLDNLDPSLAAETTKATEGGSQSYVVDAMIEAGKNAGDPNVTGTLTSTANVVEADTAAAAATAADADAEDKDE
jgi:hypothetical protein